MGYKKVVDIAEGASRVVERLRGFGAAVYKKVFAALEDQNICLIQDF
jgi:hypothetical protein